MSKLYLGSIDVTKIDKSKLFTGKKGTYLDVQIWVNDDVDKYDQIGSISTGKKDDKVYLGNIKEHKLTPHDHTPQSEQADKDASNTPEWMNSGVDPADDLPF